MWVSNLQSDQPCLLAQWQQEWQQDTTHKSSGPCCQAVDASSILMHAWFLKKPSEKTLLAASNILTLQHPRKLRSLWFITDPNQPALAPHTGMAQAPLGWLNSLPRFADLGGSTHGKWHTGQWFWWISSLVLSISEVLHLPCPQLREACEETNHSITWTLFVNALHLCTSIHNAKICFQVTNTPNKCYGVT